MAVHGGQPRHQPQDSHCPSAHTLFPGWLSELRAAWLSGICGWGCVCGGARSVRQSWLDAGTWSAWDQGWHIRQQGRGCPGVAADGQAGSAQHLRPDSLCQGSRAVPHTHAAVPWTSEGLLKKISSGSCSLFPGSAHADRLKPCCSVESSGAVVGPEHHEGALWGITFWQMDLPSGRHTHLLWPPAVTCSL